MIRKQLGACLALAFLLFTLVATEPARAVETKDDSGDFKIVLVPYGWMTGFSGTFGARGHETRVTTSFADMSKYLNFAAMAHLEVLYRDTVGLIAEFNYAGLGDQVSRRGVSLDGQMSFTMSDVALFYRIGTIALNEDGGKVSFDVLGGVRIWTLDMGLSADYLQYGDSIHMQRTWVDPVVGARASIHFNKKWLLDLRGGVGGFGVSSTFTWDAMGLIGYNFWENATLLVGYRAVGLNYEEGSGRNAFKANATLHGPVLGLSFTF